MYLRLFFHPCLTFFFKYLPKFFFIQLFFSMLIPHLFKPFLQQFFSHLSHFWTTQHLGLASYLSKHRWQILLYISLNLQIPAFKQTILFLSFLVRFLSATPEVEYLVQ